MHHPKPHGRGTGPVDALAAVACSLEWPKTPAKDALCPLKTGGKGSGDSGSSVEGGSDMKEADEEMWAGGMEMDMEVTHCCDMINCCFHLAQFMWVGQECTQRRDPPIRQG